MKHFWILSEVTISTRSLAVIAAVVSVSHASFASTVNVSQSKAPTQESESDGSKTVELNADVGLVVGTSSNIGKLSTPTSGNYLKISPSVGAEYLLSEVTVLNTALSADLKRFTDGASKNLGNESKAEARFTLIGFLGEQWELGGDLGGIYSAGRVPLQITSTETAALEQRYFEPDSRLYAAWTKGAYSAEAGASGKIRRYSTITEDRGNTFKNDYTSYGLDLKLKRVFSKAFSLSVKGVLENKTYSERPADFSDGAASPIGASHPFLEESSGEGSLVAEYRVGKLVFVTTPSYRKNKDRIFGARDSGTFRIQEKMTLPISKSLTFSPTASYARESFDHFRADPEANILGGALRTDSEWRVSVPMKYSVTRSISVSAAYDFVQKDSNYAGSSYSDHSVSTGVTVSM